jgi:ubiquinone/menaquinone biosynthesis C-methylase UbiE
MVNWHNWFYKKAPEIFKECGISPGDIVIDFGAGEGDYTIPIATFINQENSKGKVIAIDKDEYNLKKLKDQAQRLNLLNNIQTIHNNGELAINKQANFADAVLVFDILHYFTKDERNKLYKEVHRVLIAEGLLITFPNHYRDLYPLWNLRKLSLNEIIEEIEAHDFRLKYRWKGELIHDHAWFNGIILSFQKL